MGARRRVYLDNHATTQPDPRVVEAMLPFFREFYGNAASKQHEFGWKAEAAVEGARTRVAALIGAAPRQVFFTSGATESINLALKGVVERASATRERESLHCISVSTEHRAALDVGDYLRRTGVEVTVLPVDGDGLVNPDDLRGAIKRSTVLVNVMLANNEIGTIAPVKEVAALCAERGILLHTDATQAAGRIPVNVERLGVDLVSVSAHKIYGPKGVGALVVRGQAGRAALAPQMHGGGHEGGLRSGTLNVPAIVGFGRAAEIAAAEMTEEGNRIGDLRELLVRLVRDGLDDVTVNGHPEFRLPGNASLTIEGARADRVLMDMKDVAVSSGSACSSASPEPSHVLRAIGRTDEQAASTLRYGLGRFTTEEDVRYAAERLVAVVSRIRSTVASRTMYHS
jgi:cysteine desulfurase